MEPRISIITLGVKDLQKSYEFYNKGLGFEVSTPPSGGIHFFKTGGTCLAIYPIDKMAKEFDPPINLERSGRPSFTLAHNTKTQSEVDDILKLAKAAGGKIEKPATKVFWGGYSGYFSDPDGYFWEVAHADFWEFNPDGSLIIR